MWLKVVAWPLVKKGAAFAWTGIVWLWTVRVPLLFVVVLALLMVWADIQQRGMAHEIEELRQRLSTAEDTARANLDTVRTLEVRLADCIGQHDASQRLADQVTAERDLLRERLTQARAIAARERSDIYANDATCAPLLAVGVCDPVLDRLHVPARAD